jgi:hypothetical protein
MTLADGPATLAGCAAIFLGYALFSVYKRSDFADLTGGFWIPLLLLFALRRRNPSGSFWERCFDGSAAPLALVVAGIWLSNGPEGIMASYLLAAIALVSAFVERSLVPVTRAIASTIGGMGLASLYLIPAVSERNWMSIQYALNPIQYMVENNWLFGLGGDPNSTSNDVLLHQISKIAVFMLIVTFAAGAIAWIRRAVPGERRWWLPIALIPPTILFMLLPISQPVWHTLPELRILQFPWRWLVVLQAPMGICFASAVWFNQRTLRIVVITACAAVFVGISFMAQRWWFSPCGSLTSLEELAREGIGFIGKPEYSPPGTRFPLVDFLLDSKGDLQADPQGNVILNVIPEGCLLENSPETFVQGETGPAPAWRGESANCNSAGWRQLSLIAGASGAAEPNYLPEQKWFRGVAEHAGYAIVRLRYFPAWAVKVNGVPVTAVAEQDRGLMAVPVPKGNVLISADWTTTGDVVAARLVSGVALLLVICLFLFERKLSRAHLSLDGRNPVDSTASDIQIRNAKRKKARKSRDGGG